MTLCGLLLYYIVARASKRRFDAEFFFIIFLLGQAASFFLILAASWGVALRYWYVLIPIYTLLMAFSCKYILEVIMPRSRLVRHMVAMAFCGFIVYFIGANYYNFLGQTLVQHNLRQTETKLIDKITDLHDQGPHKIYILESRDEHVINLVRYFRRFSPRYDDHMYDGIVIDRPREESQPYYTVTLHRRPIETTMANAPEECSTIISIIGNYNRQQVSHIYHIASLLRMGPPHWLMGPPHWSKDAGVARVERYHWTIRRVSCSGGRGVVDAKSSSQW